jgi:hypothetical protein
MSIQLQSRSPRGCLEQLVLTLWRAGDVPFAIKCRTEGTIKKHKRHVACPSVSFSARVGLVRAQRVVAQEAAFCNRL